jgi:hypothetical protein
LNPQIFGCEIPVLPVVEEQGYDQNFGKANESWPRWIKSASKVHRSVMKHLHSTMKAICLFLFLIVSLAGTVKAQRPLRVLIDASKDGGLWWFPQSGTFDPKRYHQGKRLADFMRGKGWDVIEVPRGEIVTFERLRGADFVIRPPVYFNYSVKEIEAYRDSVIAGTRVLLIGGSAGNNNDSIAEVFGLRFESRTRFGSVRQWMKHPLTADIEGKDLPWTTISESPPSAVHLAWLNQLETDPQPVLGYLTYGNGYVVFVGQSLITLPPFSASLINSLGRYNLEELRQLPLAGPVFAVQSLERSARLLEPEPEATLPQPEVGEWRFDWEDIPAATGYEIVVLGPSAVVPIVRGTTTTSEYVIAVSPGYVADHNLRGWSWRVRCRYPNGAWSSWSTIRRFNVTARAR